MFYFLSLNICTRMPENLNVYKFLETLVELCALSIKLRRTESFVVSVDFIVWFDSRTYIKREMIPHIQRHPRAFFPLPRRVRAMAVASCERCYRPLTGCITKLCKAPTCAINIFKNPPCACSVGMYVYTIRGYLFR